MALPRPTGDGGLRQQAEAANAARAQTIRMAWRGSALREAKAADAAARRLRAHQ
jgi:hypothetical protein